jgi:hypothetical protein
MVKIMRRKDGMENDFVISGYFPAVPLKSNTVPWRDYQVMRPTVDVALILLEPEPPRLAEVPALAVLNLLIYEISPAGMTA